MESQSSQNLDSEPASIDDVLVGNFHVNKNGEVRKKRETRPDMTEGELGVIFDFLDARYDELYGRGSGSDYSTDKDDVWKELVDAVNHKNGGQFK